MNKRERIIRTRRKRLILKRLIQVEMLVAIALCCFLIGRKTGIDTAEREFTEAIQSSGVSQILAAGNQNSSVVEALDQHMEEKERELVLSSTEKLALLWDKHPELLLVNKDNRLPEDYEVELDTLADGRNKAAMEVYDALSDMLKAGRKEGLRFEVCSSYRSVERQKELLDEDIDALMRKGYTYDEAYEEATRETMPPGYSEHATGMAFDIVSLDYQLLDAKQQYTEESKWLRQNCAKYGFILRYPEGKEAITGISYESWHFRYVGTSAAEYIMKQGITLEEYIEEYLQNNIHIDI